VEVLELLLKKEKTDTTSIEQCCGYSFNFVDLNMCPSIIMDSCNVHISFKYNALILNL